MNESIAFYQHNLGLEELASISSVFETPCLTTGPKVLQFEEEFAQLLDVDFCVGVSSCTGALHLALEALGVGHGDEVLVPGLTFAATALAVMHAGATPVLVDVDRNDGLIDLNRIEEAVTSRTRAVIPVHLYGQMVDMHELSSIAQELGIFVVEDAAHCIEGVRDGVRPGQLSDAACFSFYATKNLTCGEGGAFVSQSRTVTGKVRSARTHGLSRTAADQMSSGYKPWDIREAGWKYNMDDIQAAILLPQLKHVASRVENRSKLAVHYDSYFTDVEGLEIPRRTGEVHAHHLYTIQVDPEVRTACMAALSANKIGFTVNYPPLSAVSALKGLRQHPKDLPNSSHIGSRTISLPLYPDLSMEDADRVAKTVLSALC